MRRTRCYTAPSLAQEVLAKTRINGVRKTIYSVNGDSYTGEWKDNKKHGKIDYLGKFARSRHPKMESFTTCVRGLLGRRETMRSWSIGCIG